MHEHEGETWAQILIKTLIRVDLCSGVRSPEEVSFVLNGPTLGVQVVNSLSYIRVFW